MPFSQLSLYYGADNNLRVIRNYTNSDNTADSSTTLVTQPVIPPGGYAPRFEMRVVPSNNTHIVQNDYANWRGLDVGVGYVKHRLEVADDAPPGTISASTTLSVQVRRKAYTADQVTGSVVFNNTLTTEGEVAPPEPTTFEYDAAFLGADSRTGSATLALQKVNDTGRLVVRERLLGTNPDGDWVNADVIVGSHIYDADAPLPGHSVRIDNVQVSGIGGADYVNNASSYNSSDEVDLFRITADATASDMTTTVSFRVTVRRDVDAEVVAVWGFTFRVASYN